MFSSYPGVWLTLVLCTSMACGWLASKKGRNVAVWAVLGVVFPLLSLGIILGLDSKRAAGYRG